MLRTRRLLALAALFALAAAGCSNNAAADKGTVKVKFYVTVPLDTAPSERIFLAGNLPQVGGWKADGVALTRTSGGQYVAELDLPHGRLLEYKITRGSWETVEKGAGDEEITNRKLQLNGDGVERVTVARWRNDATAARGGADATTRRASTITGDVRVHDVESTLLKNRRKVHVWLPPGYETSSDARYPVLYMHDGQNVFDEATSFAGEWQADETADRLVRAGKIPPIIIVAIENSVFRALEFTPGVVNGIPGRAPLYGRFVVEEVKPLIDRTYRTKSGFEDTAVAGSSLGAIVSLHMLRAHAQTFSRCAAVSPSLWWGQRQFLDELRGDVSWARGRKLWLDMGTAESPDPDETREGLENASALAAALESGGLVAGRDFMWRRVEGAQHNEQAWAARFGDILVFLFGK